MVDDGRCEATDEQRMTWHVGLAEARFRLGDISGARLAGLTAMRLSGNPVPTTLVGQLLGILRGVAGRVAVRWLPRRLRTASGEERPRRLALTRVLNRLTEVAIYGEDALSCLDVGLRELNMAEPSGPSPELGRAYAVMAVVIGTIPLHRVARAWTARALTVSEPSGETPELAYALSRVGVYEIYVADWANAEAHAQRAADIATRLGDWRLRAEGLVIKGLSLYYSGRLVAPLALWEQTRQAAAFSANAQILAWSHIADAGALIRLGRAAEAVVSLRAAATWAVDHGTRTEKILVHGLLALATLRTGDRGAARVEADSALDLISGRPPVAYWMQHAVAAVCQAYLELWREAVDSGDSTAARELPGRARKALFGLRWFALVFPFGRAHASLWAGHYAWLNGSTRAAQKHCRRGLARAEQYDQGSEHALALRALGASASGAERRDLLQRAVGELQSMEAERDRALAQRMLESDDGPTP